MDFADAIRAHVAWKVRLRMVLDGQGERMSSDEAARDDACDLGRWIHGEGRRHFSKPAYRELKEVHARFHQVAAEVLAASERGDRRAAEAGLEGAEYVKSSSAVVAAIMRMREAAA